MYCILEGITKQKHLIYNPEHFKDSVGEEALS